MMETDWDVAINRHDVLTSGELQPRRSVLMIALKATWPETDLAEKKNRYGKSGSPERKHRKTKHFLKYTHFFRIFRHLCLRFWFRVWLGSSRVGSVRLMTKVKLFASPLLENKTSGKMWKV